MKFLLPFNCLMINDRSMHAYVQAVFVLFAFNLLEIQRKKKNSKQSQSTTIVMEIIIRQLAAEIFYSIHTNALIETATMCTT